MARKTKKTDDEPVNKTVRRFTRNGDAVDEKPTVRRSVQGEPNPAKAPDNSDGFGGSIED